MTCLRQRHHAPTKLGVQFCEGRAVQDGELGFTGAGANPYIVREPVTHTAHHVDPATRNTLITPDETVNVDNEQPLRIIASLQFIAVIGLDRKDRGLTAVPANSDVSGMMILN